MSIPTLQLPVRDLTAGQYFKHNRHWYKAERAVDPRTPASVDVTLITPEGDRATFIIWDTHFEVAAPGHIPGPFLPATVRAKQARARKEIALLQRLIIQLDQLELTQLGEVRRNTDAQHEASREGTA